MGQCNLFKLQVSFFLFLEKEGDSRTYPLFL